MYQGQLKSWNEDRGFGFISSQQLETDVFLHISTLKHMKRPPKQGDVIYFETTKQDNGKLKATNCRIQGVPFKEQRTKRRGNNRLSFKLSVLLIVLVVAFIYQRVIDSPNDSLPTPTLNLEDFTTPSAEFKHKTQYRCESKQHCSQMRSCEEAEFYIANCPNTKMDGDGDGIPCERQWCR